MMRLFLVAALSWLAFSGCGYKPASHYTQAVLSDRIFADVQISRDDPRGAGIMADALREAVVARFGGRLTSREEADTHLQIINASQSTTALQRDEQGFVVLYRSKVTLTTRINSPSVKNRTIQTSGSYDFAVSADSVLSESERTGASRQAAGRALDELLARLVLMGR
jgi:hypothetical protein